MNMDHRLALPRGSTLLFPGMCCEIDRCIGRGSNALVYEASYQDVTSRSRKHHVLIKELFPFDIYGHIWRDGDSRIQRDSEGEALWQTHLLSFERGNDIHLQLLALRTDRLGGNLNTFSLNDTLYTLLDDSGSRSLDSALGGSPGHDLRTAARRCMYLLDCLDVFHAQDFLHLDISLDNVLLTGEGDHERVMLIDYNSVHSRSEIRGGREMYFSAKEGFTAPETQMGMRGSMSFCTDLYSVTAVFYAMLLGRPPSTIQLNRKNPPDAQDSPLLMEVPSTVREQVKRIMRRGLCVLPEKRYVCCADMKADLAELIRRLDGLGVSHAALWEAGRRSVKRLVRNNPSLSYLEREAELYPLRAVWRESGGSVNLDILAQGVFQRQDKPVLLEGAGGIGKSTALLRTILSAPEVYSASRPAMIYLTLHEWREADGHFIFDQILRELRFDAETRTMEDARHALLEALSKPLVHRGEERPALLLLLDGLNEASGDTAGLIREIASLSHLPGLSMVIASRTLPEDLPVIHARLTPLCESDVDAALMRHGLLMPEAEGMRALLRMPLMLSLFVQTSMSQNTQVQCETDEELVDAYLNALCDKESSNGSRYQTEAAVYLVLPAIALAMQGHGAAMNDPSMLPIVVKCRRWIDTRTLSRVFPQWLGHGSEITEAGDMQDEAWYGHIVHDILWRRLGLLIRDGTGSYQIRHQVLREHLARMGERNRAAIRRARFRAGVIGAGALTGLICAILVCYVLWFMPKPYDHAMSEMVLGEALTQYVNTGLQYEAVLSLLEDEITPETCAGQLQRYGTPASQSVQTALQAMKDSAGSVIPWSGTALDFENCLSLLRLPEERAEGYTPYLQAYRSLIDGDRVAERSAFSAALSEMIEADADLAWLLDRAVSFPHLQGMSDEQEKVYHTGLLSLPAAQEARSPDLSRGIDYALQKARERSREARRKLTGMAAMHEG